MPGLAGVVDSTHIDDAVSLLDRMLASIRSQDWHTQERSVDPNGHWAVGRISLGLGSEPAQPARLPGIDALGFVYGRLHLDPAERRELAGGAEGGANGGQYSDAQLVLAAYERSDGRLPRSVRGSYAILIVDRSRKKILIANDAIGQRPIYYCVRRGRLLFGSLVDAILQDPSVARRMDAEAMADLFEYRYVLGNKTLFEGISLLPPGARLTYDLTSGHVSIEEIDSVEDWFGADVDNRPADVVLDELAELFAVAAFRVCDDTLQNTVSLSGGMDSRAIMSVIRPKDTRINAFTAGLPGSSDKRLGRRIAKAAHCESMYSDMSLSTLEADNYVRLSRQAIELTDGMRGSSFHAMTAYMANRYHELGLQVVLTGHGGEFAKLDHAYGFSIDARKDLGVAPQACKDLIFNKMSDQVWRGIDRRKLFTGKMAPVDNELVRSSYEREYAKIGSSLPLEQQLSYFFLRDLLRKHAVLSNSIHANYCEIEYPFIAEDFVRAVLRTPLALRLDYRIHRRIIETHNPALLQIPVSDTRVRLDAGRLEQLLIRRPYEILFRLGFFQVDIPETYIPKNVPTTVFDGVLLTPRCLDRGDLDPTYLRQIIDRYKGGEYSLFHPLMGLLTLEYWNQFYFER